MVRAMKQFEAWIVAFDSSLGSEITKSRPAVIFPKNIINELYQTVIVAPLTTASRDYPTRVDTNFEEKGGQIALDQLKCFEKTRLKKKIGEIPLEEQQDILDILSLIFQPVS
jgi:mRNA interferase MazF